MESHGEETDGSFQGVARELCAPRVLEGKKMQANLNSGIDFDELDALVSEAAPALRQPTNGRAGVYRPSSAESDLAPTGTLLWRLVKNTTPQLVSDALSLMLSGVVAEIVIRLMSHGEALHWQFAAVAALPLICAYWLGGLYSGIGVHPVTELREVFQFNTIAFGAAAIGTMFLPLVSVWCFAAWLASIALVPLSRGFVRRWCARRSWWGHPMLIISTGAKADHVAGILLRAPASGLRPIMVTDPSNECRSSVLPVENNPAAVERFVRQNAIRHAVLWLPDLPHSQFPVMVDRYSRMIPHLLLASDSTALPSLWHTHRSVGHLAGLEVRNGRMLVGLQFIKRSVDVGVSGAALLLCSPLLVFMVLAVRFSSEGPIFFSHTRIGANGRRFAAWKFRTMYSHGDKLIEKHLEQHPNAMEEWLRDHKLRDDPRVTPLGRLLRSWSLDELPQIWNVLRGDMSIVGPRPIVNEEVVRYGDVFDLYTSVKPGITGLWQVSGRNNTTYDERVRFDAYYVLNWSPWLDVYILIKTVVTIIRRTGAY
jgi:Undecaprenyl-phosphate galactose phosphotransferase WbaP